MLLEEQQIQKANEETAVRVTTCDISLARTKAITAKAITAEAVPTVTTTTTAATMTTAHLVIHVGKQVTVKIYVGRSIQSSLPIGYNQSSGKRRQKETVTMAAASA